MSAGTQCTGRSNRFGRPSPFFVGMRKSERFSRGDVCMTEYAACANGTECLEASGVEPEPMGQFDRFPPPRVAFCVHIAHRGESRANVEDKFTSKCGEGLRSEKGKCTKANSSEAPIDEKVTLAGVRAMCLNLQFVPGLICERDEFGTEKMCALPPRTVGVHVDREKFNRTM